MQTSVTIKSTQSYSLNNTLQVDENNVPLTSPDPSYGAPVYVSSDDTIVYINDGPKAEARGIAGTATITGTETSTDTTKPVLTGTVVITVTAPVPASLEIEGSVIDN